MNHNEQNFGLKKWLLVAIACFASPQVWAFKQFETPFMEILENDSVKPEDSTTDPWFISPFHYSIYNPTGRFAALSKAPEDCQNFDFFKKDKSFFESSARLLATWKKCEPYFFSGYIDPLSQILRTTGIEFDRVGYPWSKAVEFSLQPEDRLRGVLFLKDFVTPRPLVIVRGGIFSSSKGIKAELYLILMLFEQSQANVLFLESTSSPQYQTRNKRWVFLGAEEGYQLLEIAKKIQSESEPISKIITEVSLAGVSLGGNGVLFANLVQQELIKNKLPQIFKKSLAFCPLVDGEGTLRHHIDNRVSHFILNQTLEVRYEKLRVVKGATDLSIQGLLAKVESELPPIRPREFPIPESLKSRILEQGKVFWTWNSFWKDYQKVSTPLLIFTSQNDSLVPFQLNSQKLIQNSKDSVVSLVELQRGQHCSIPGAYEWYPISKIINNYLFSDSQLPPLKKVFSESIGLSYHQIEEFAEMGTNLDITSENGNLFLRVFIDSDWWEFWKQKEVLFKLKLDQSNTDLAFSTDTLKSALISNLTRWFNSNMSVVFDPSSGKLNFSWPYFGQQ